MFELIKSQYGGIGISHWTPLILVAALAVPLKAMACTPNPSNLVPSDSANYTEHEAGEIISDWKARSSAYLTECAVNEIIDLTLTPALESVGAIDGVETFRTSNSNIGVQFQYRYPNSRALNGTIRWSAWIDLESGADSIRVYGDSAAEITASSIYMEYRIRFVAINKLSGNQDVGRVRPVEVTLDSASYAINQFEWERFSLVAPRASVCSFVGDVDGMSVGVPTTHISALSNEDDMGEASAFSWSWRCDGGAGAEANPNGDFKYESTTTVIEEEGGRMSVTGDARGVDLLVTRLMDDGEEEPIVFNRWYGDFGELGLSGTERMRVRFIRNKSPLVAGEASAGLLIKIEPR